MLLFGDSECSSLATSLLAQTEYLVNHSSEICGDYKSIQVRSLSSPQSCHIQSSLDALPISSHPLLHFLFEAEWEEHILNFSARGRIWGQGHSHGLRINVKVIPLNSPRLQLFNGTTLETLSSLSIDLRGLDLAWPIWEFKLSNSRFYQSVYTDCAFLVSI